MLLVKKELSAVTADSVMLPASEIFPTESVPEITELEETYRFLAILALPAIFREPFVFPAALFEFVIITGVSTVKKFWS